ncbi:hypothetical protein SAMN04487767_1015 [Bacillus wiedmannii]|uniref:DUF4393 domain-containing protein n=1 Tax=Bacillus wiedmannii TaxID=1890302 RepID=A0A1G6I6Y9_9BACI|nr:hypothetical protein [Bacillus wiedmannii]KMP28123.1 hypothetical protein TU50_13110 [Bacillus wiedmannii]SDC02221.1 hypothetical protein SAMN04487767_1015 [Bacillus wiedmannii]
MTEKLNFKEKAEIAIQTGLQLVPYVGPSLSAAYFGTKQEKRFKRIESFYQEFSSLVEELKLQIPSIEQHDEEELITLIEELNEKVEREHTTEKKEFFKRYLLNTLMTPTDQNFDEKRFFLDILSNMTLLECELLTLLHHQDNYTTVRDIVKFGVDQYAIVGAIGRLKLYGLLSTTLGNFAVGGGDNSLNELVKPSTFGEKFINYCLE